VSTPRSTAPVLVTGGSGMLGSALARALGPRAVALDIDTLDICDKTAVTAVLGRTGSRLVVNCAAATDVDRCETDRAHADAANVEGPAVLAGVCAARGVGLVHMSTDYVFDGRKDAPYTEDDSPSPLSYYGLTKRWGEEAVLATAGDPRSVLVVRTSWLFGWRGEQAAGFPAKVLEWSARAKSIRAVADQWGSPTYASFLATGILGLIGAGAHGVYHLAGDGCASRLEIAREVVTQAGLKVDIEPVGCTEFPAAAARPRQSCLDCARAAALGVRLPTWTEGVRRYLVELQGGSSAGSDRGPDTPGDSIPERTPDQS